jgi:DNA replication and repair protein RecF
LRLQSLKITQFRKFDRYEVEQFHPQLNVIVGKNAQGKTSLLEAISILLQLKSFRTSSSQDFIKVGRSEASIQAITSEPTFNQILISLEGRKKSIRVDDKKVFSRSKYDFLGSAISFVPDDLYLIKGGPESRRTFFDDFCVSVASANDLVFQQFQKILKQRNKLIKEIRDGRAGLQHLSLWTDQFIEISLKVYTLRSEHIEKCSKILPQIYEELFGVKEDLRIEYLTGFENHPPSFDEMAQRIGRLGQVEIAAGYSLVGPHRDDYAFYLQNKEVRAFGSQGQIRGIVIALKVAQMELASQTRLGPPILLLDDIISELDEGRILSLVHYLARYQGQLFVTTAEIAKLKTLHQRFSSFKLIELQEAPLKPLESPLNLT